MNSLTLMVYNFIPLNEEKERRLKKLLLFFEKTICIAKLSDALTYLEKRIATFKTSCIYDKNFIENDFKNARNSYKNLGTLKKMKHI